MTTEWDKMKTMKHYKDYLRATLFMYDGHYLLKDKEININDIIEMKKPEPFRDVTIVKGGFMHTLPKYITEQLKIVLKRFEKQRDFRACCQLYMDMMVIRPFKQDSVNYVPSFTLALALRRIGYPFLIQIDSSKGYDYFLDYVNNESKLEDFEAYVNNKCDQLIRNFMLNVIND